MTELSPGARALIEAARQAGGPSTLERAQLKAALDARIAADVAVTSAAVGGGGAAVKLALVAVLAGGAVMGGVWWAAETPVASPAAPQTPRAEVELPRERTEAESITAPAPSAPARAAMEVPAPSPARDGARAQRHLRRAAASAAPDRVELPLPTAPPRPADTLAAELVLIGAAEEALAGGQLEQARAAIARHALEHDAGALREERAALQILLDCATAHDPPTAARAAAFIAARRGTPVAARIEAACRLAPATSAP